MRFDAGVDANDFNLQVAVCKVGEQCGLNVPSSC